MQPKIELLSDDMVRQILDESYQILLQTGVKVQSINARRLLADAGAQVDPFTEVVKISESLIAPALETTPSSFTLFDRAGNQVISYGGDAVHFDPGSSGVNMLDSVSGKHHAATTSDLITLVKIVEMLQQYDAQSTAIVCSDVPKTISDLYRLFIVLSFSQKPIVTGSFSVPTLQTMIEMLNIVSGGREELVKKPLAVFDVCPSPPLIWSNFASENLIILARQKVPVELVSMPLTGAASPITLLGSIVQHTVENLSGLLIHQLACPGSPLVWGGAPAIFDMRKGSTPFGAAETAMLSAATTQVGKSLQLPTHTYLGASDAKFLDAQAGMESGMSFLIGALAGINMISGAGMLDFLACQSLEKLVFDAEAIAWTKRLLNGIKIQTQPFALNFYENFSFKPDFLKQKATRDLFSQEQILPSLVIDRGSVRGWQMDGKLDLTSRASVRIKQLLANYEIPGIDPACSQELLELVKFQAGQAGMSQLPVLA